MVPVAGANGGDPLKQWEKHSLTAIHNSLWKGDPSHLFTAAVNSSLDWQTM